MPMVEPGFKIAKIGGDTAEKYLENILSVGQTEKCISNPFLKHSFQPNKIS